MSPCQTFLVLCTFDCRDAAASPTRMTTNAEPLRRPLTVMEMQGCLFKYGLGITVFSAPLSAYQICKLYRAPVPVTAMLRSATLIFPHQTVLKMAQMNACKPVKDYLNPWAAFAAVGVLQGGVYGQANIHFTKSFNLVKTAPSLAGLFRGSGFAGARDMLSQGVPFVFSGPFRQTFLDSADSLPPVVKTYGSVLTMSAVGTVLSQGLHNCQIMMQSNQGLSYAGALRSVYEVHGVSALYKGAEARMGLLMVVNVLNELLLKPAWEGVPVEQ